MSKQKHSHSYHRYFENYAEKEILLPGGGRTIQRVYVGQYYRVDLPDDQLRRQRRQLLVLFLLSLAGYLAGALMAKISAVSLVALATMPPLVAVLFYGTAVFYRLTVPREMEIRAYRDSSENLISSSRIFLICMLVCFAFSLGGSLLVPGYSAVEAFPSLFCYLVSARAAWKACLLEKNTPYRRLEPKQERPAESSPIRYEMPD